MSLTPTQKGAVRRAITDFCQRAEASRLKWNYAQIRPYSGIGVAPELHHVDDCSAYVALAYNFAMHRTGIYLADPLNEQYSGYGYTGSELDYLKNNPAPVDKYLVGDLAIFGTAWNTEHTSVCRKAGTTNTAVFSSNGHQSWIFGQDAPEPVSLSNEKAQQALVGVFRHPGLV